jgi:hypothetical protein
MSGNFRSLCCPYTSEENRTSGTSGAKALINPLQFGTAEAVPFVKSLLRRESFLAVTALLLCIRARLQSGRK